MGFSNGFRAILQANKWHEGEQGAATMERLSVLRQSQQL
jgi:hypothetical protein